MNLLAATLFSANVILAIYGNDSFPAFISNDAEAALTPWFAKHPSYHLLVDDDCRCDDDLKAIRSHSIGAWKAQSDYHPYFTVGDFNGDGQADLAVGIAERNLGGHIRILIIDNFRSLNNKSPTQFLSNEFPGGTAIFFGAPRPKPYRLVVGPFESEGTIFEPTLRGEYQLISP